MRDSKENFKDEIGWDEQRKAILFLRDEIPKIKGWPMETQFVGWWMGEATVQDIELFLMESSPKHLPAFRKALGAYAFYCELIASKLAEYWARSRNKAEDLKVKLHEVQPRKAAATA